MDEQEKQAYLKKYKLAKENGEYFFPEAIFKDAIVALAVFLLLVSLAYFIGAPLEARANPADTNYTPRPEWYFLFLFQLLKYFPGNLEVIGVVLIPTLAIILLLLLPALDRSTKRHAFGRPIVIGVTALILSGIILLTVQAYRETPPPAEAATGDQVANLYLKNCAVCHGQTINVTAGTNLHDIIAQGSHGGMPSWNADLSGDEIDAIAGFISSPRGNSLYRQYCEECHDVTELVSINPFELKAALDNGAAYTKHADQDILEWKDVMSVEDRTALLNFLVAPDGQRLFATNCSSCHGRSVTYEGDAAELKKIISQGGMHKEMPSWQEKINERDITTLANFVVNPSKSSDGQKLFERYCAACHGNQIPTVDSVENARQVIALGGPHETMPVWGETLTEEQLDALVAYTLSTAQGTSVDLGQKLFVSNCAPCHGEFGEGGVNPAQSGDIIAPISTGEYLRTRDDFTLRAIITEGQPNLGMSSFGTSFGGPLSDEEIDAIVTFLRSWEENPPVEIPPEVKSGQAGKSAEVVFSEFCAQCHGSQGEGGLGPALNTSEIQDKYTDEGMYWTIYHGHKSTAMISWGAILSSEQIQELVAYIGELYAKQIAISSGEPPAEIQPGELSFQQNVLPIFSAKCNMCHGSSGGWDGTTYDSVMSSGDHAPVIIPGDEVNSLLAEKLLGTQEIGGIMPPFGSLADAEIQLILAWIKAGAVK